MKQDLTEIIAIIDKSGSMHDLTSDTIGNFNNFLAEQRLVPGEAKMALTLFNHIVNFVVPPSTNIDAIKPLDDKTYHADGNTALYDAIGKTVTAVGESISLTAEEDRPSKIIVLIITDGLENSSQEYDQEQIATMIKHQQDVYNWEFIFMGANIDAPAVAMAMNIPMANSANFAASSEGLATAYNESNSRITRSRNAR